jgi:hypothetical protein
MDFLEDDDDSNGLNGKELYSKCIDQNKEKIRSPGE